MTKANHLSNVNLNHSRFFYVGVVVVFCLFVFWGFFVLFFFVVVFVLFLFFVIFRIGVTILRAPESSHIVQTLSNHGLNNIILHHVDFESFKTVLLVALGSWMSICGI